MNFNEAKHVLKRLVGCDSVLINDTRYKLTNVNSNADDETQNAFYYEYGYNGAYPMSIADFMTAEFPKNSNSVVINNTTFVFLRTVEVNLNPDYSFGVYVCKEPTDVIAHEIMHRVDGEFNKQMAVDVFNRHVEYYGFLDVSNTVAELNVQNKLTPHSIGLETQPIEHLTESLSFEIDEMFDLRKYRLGE